jgi:membrane-associated phospholipid phosphatase
MTQLAVTLGGAIALYDILKPLVGRPRPHVGPLVTTATGYAFPSGHATQITAVAVALATRATPRASSWARKVAIWAAAALVCLLVGFTRLYLGVHWPTDVLAGYAFGALWAAIVTLAFRAPRLRTDARRRPRSPG